MLRRLNYRHAIALFLNSDKGGGDGGSTEPKTLAEAKARLQEDGKKLTEVEAKAATAENDLKEARAENERLRGQFDAATQAAATANTERDQARTELQQAQTQIGTLTGERDQARGQLATANENVSRLEQLCQVKGIDPKTAVPQTPAADSKAAQIDALVAQMEASNDPKERTNLARKIRALRENREV